jgi:serine/threonine-protein kinase SRPK3
LYKQVFELLTGRWLFDPSAGHAWNIVDDHLAKMQEITGEMFSTDLLGRAAEGNKYFNDSGVCISTEFMG